MTAMVSALLRRFEQQWSVQSDELRPFASVDSGRSKRELDQSAYKHPRGFFLCHHRGLDRKLWRGRLVSTNKDADRRANAGNIET
jgi:hypothetical protein